MTPEHAKSSNCSRREFLKTSALAATGLALSSSCVPLETGAPKDPPARRPNIILMLMDEIAFDAIGYANPFVKTPHLDQLARGGMIFNAGHVASMPCVPSRACMISGVHHHRWERISSNPFHAFLKEGNWTWANALREAGYQTGVIGALHAMPIRADYGFDTMQLCDWGSRADMESGDARNRDDYFEWMKAQGLDERRQPDGSPVKSNGVMDGYHWPHGIDKHPISWVRDRAIEYIDNHRTAKQDYLAYISFKSPHSPYHPAEPYASMYDPASIPIPTDTWTDMEGYVPALDFDPKEGYNGISARPKDADFQRLMSKYYGMITQVDDAIGKILTHVDLNNTLVLFIADHGDYCGKRGRILKLPVVPFEAIARVPFFASGAGVPRGAVCENPVSTLDVAPTFLHAAGLDIPEGLDGQPLQSYFANPRAGANRIIYTWSYHGLDAVQQGSLKYFRSRDGKNEMLFDLSTDPDEKRNIASAPQHADAKARLAREMDRIQALPPSTLPRYEPAP